MKKFIQILIYTILTLSAAAATINIKADGTGDYSTIQAAIDAANPHDEIVLADGIYSGQGNRDIDPNGKNVIIKSQNGPDNCIIDCNGSESENHRGFYFHNGEDINSVIDGITIKNGYAIEGGAVICNQSNPVITNCVFINNIADSNEYGGGAICNILCTPRISNCTFSNNKVYEGCGGGICNYGSLGNVVIDNCTFTGNSVFNIDGGFGGAIYNWQQQGSMTLTDCTFNSNSATDSNGEGGGGAICAVSGSTTVSNSSFIGNYADMLGGGIWSINDQTGPKITNCVFSYNDASGGGGLCSSGSNPVVKNCLFEGNKAVGDNFYSGGGLLNWGGGLAAISNCTFTGNSAYCLVGGFGGAICSYTINSSISNCIFDNNRSRNGNEIALIGVGSASVNYSNIDSESVYVWLSHTLNWGFGNIDTDPCFVNAGYWDANDTASDVNDDLWVTGDYHLLEQSLCINTGDPNYVAAIGETDLDGLTRVIGGRIDMGCYEFNHQPVAVAGQDQTVYACFDNLADVVLDGSGSYDEDGGELDYHWSWTINGNDYEANGINPTITLPVGEHTIKLIVGDGWVESEPSYCIVNVIEPLKVNVLCTPGVLHNKGSGGLIMAVITLPVDIKPSDINHNEPLIFMPGQVEAKLTRVFTSLGKGRRYTFITAIFDKSDCVENLSIGMNKIKIAGRLKSGQCFYGTACLYVMPSRPWPWFWFFLM